MKEILLLSMKIGNSDIINSLQPLKNNCYNCAVVVLLCRQKAAKLTERRRDYVMAASAAAGTGEKRRKVRKKRKKYESWIHTKSFYVSPAVGYLHSHFCLF